MRWRPGVATVAPWRSRLAVRIRRIPDCSLPVVDAFPGAFRGFRGSPATSATNSPSMTRIFFLPHVLRTCTASLR